MAQDPRVIRTPEELRELYQDNMKMLVKRCDDYYKGDRYEARSIATILYNLLYDPGKKTISILSQLGEKYSHRYLDSRMTNNLTLVGADAALPRTCAPRAPYRKENLCSFDDWWNKQTFEIQYKNIVFTREELVQTIRNMEGGGHADRNIQRKIAALKRTPSRWTSMTEDNNDGTTTTFIGFSLAPPTGESSEHGIYDFELASVCAIGEELLFSLTPEPDNRKRMLHENLQKPYYLSSKESEACKKFLKEDLKELDTFLESDLSQLQHALVNSACNMLQKALEIECLTSEDFEVRRGVSELMRLAELPWPKTD